jgi:hypothetical protein
MASDARKHIFQLLARVRVRAKASVARMRTEKMHVTADVTVLIMIKQVTTLSHLPS